LRRAGHGQPVAEIRARRVDQATQPQREILHSDRLLAGGVRRYCESCASSRACTKWPAGNVRACGARQTACRAAAGFKGAGRQRAALRRSVAPVEVREPRATMVVRDRRFSVAMIVAAARERVGRSRRRELVRSRPTALSELRGRHVQTSHDVNAFDGKARATNPLAR